MPIYNSRLFYIYFLFIVFIFSVNYLNDYKDINPNNILTKGTPIAISGTKTLPLILNINQNSKSSQIQKTLFTPSNLNTYVNKSNDRLNDYLINIFCSEVGGKYVKVASGSGIILSDPDKTTGIILTNAHVARHLLDSNKKCVGRTGSPTVTTHILALRYIPSHWLNKNNQYIIGDPDQSSTGEFDFAIIESTRIKPVKNNTANIYTAFRTNPKLKISEYESTADFNNVYIYSYPAQQILSTNVYNPLFQKKDLVRISSVYSSPTQNIKDSLLDVVGSKYVDHGSSGGMVISQGQSNSFIGLSSILIKNNIPQTVRVVTLKHVLSVLEYDIQNINNPQINPFLITIRNLLTKKDIDMSLIQILNNVKLTSLLEQYTRDTLVKLNILK